VCALGLNLNVGLTFLESFDSLDSDLIRSPEGIEYSYREAIEGSGEERNRN